MKIQAICFFSLPTKTLDFKINFVRKMYAGLVCTNSANIFIYFYFDQGNRIFDENVQPNGINKNDILPSVAHKLKYIMYFDEYK